MTYSLNVFLACRGNCVLGVKTNPAGFISLSGDYLAQFSTLGVLITSLPKKGIKRRVIPTIEG